MAVVKVLIETPALLIMPESNNASPSNTQEATLPAGQTKPIKRETPPEIVPIYCLTTLSAEDESAYRNEIEKDQELAWVHPDFRYWGQGTNGTLDDMYRMWTELSAGSPYHFAFFIDRESLTNRSIIIAQPDAYTMLFSNDAQKWVHANFSAYIERSQLSADTTLNVPSGRYEGYLEDLVDDVLGKRGLTFGRVAAEAFRGIWCNLDIANMSMSELVEFHKSNVEAINSPQWDQEACMEKLEGLIRKRAEGGDDIS
ncbi:hypothetical protein LTR56_011959 [Elasticomyces elasticus]|nr:hypothetical protein LTR56_011959 [Elasticomyces elasticus]KAK5759387.1 hypothetical protein LTS12_010552 [Elasticomyces elasticus]